MINEYLSKRGREKFSRFSKARIDRYLVILPYIHRLVSGSSEVVLSFGKPMDALGNPVDETGVSFDSKGNPMGLDGYFKTDGVFTPDYQRESVYTKHLASEIARSYKKHAVILSSQLVAFVFYVYLKKQKETVDIFEMMALPKNDLFVEMEELVPLIETLRMHIIQTSPDPSVFVHDDFLLEGKEFIRVGIRRLGQFHLNRPLKLYSDQKIICKDLKLLYYYANRLSGFGFEDIIFQ